MGLLGFNSNGIGCWNCKEIENNKVKKREYEDSLFLKMELEKLIKKLSKSLFCETWI